MTARVARAVVDRVPAGRAAVCLVGRCVALGAPALFVAVFFAFPVLTILGTGLGVVEHRGLASHAPFDTLADPSLRGVVWFTLWQAALSVMLTMALGIPLAWLVGRHSFHGAGALRALVTVPFVLPTVVVAVAVRALARSGVGVLDDPLAAILFAHVIFNAAIVVHVVGAAFRTLDDDRAAAARVLGASPLVVWREITWPQLRGAVVAAAALAFLFCFTSFGVVLLLGGPGRRTLEVEVYRRTVDLLDLPAAAVLSMLQLAVVGAVLLVAARLGRGAAGGGVAPRRPLPPGVPRRVSVAVGAIAVAVFGAPLALVVLRSLRVGSGWSFAHYTEAGAARRGTSAVADPIAAARTSAGLAVVAMVLTLVLVLLLLAGGAARRDERRSVSARLVVALVQLPLGLSAATLGFGMLVSLDEPPLDVRRAWWLLPVAHALVALPLVWATVAEGWRAIDPRQHHAAALLGATRARAWWSVELPQLAPALGGAAALAAGVSLGEFGATAFLFRTGDPTLPVVVFRLLGQPGAASYGQALAAACILGALAAITVVVTDRLGGGRLPKRAA